MPWYPLAKRDPGNDAGQYTDTGEPKGLLHTTEGKTYAGARQAYVVNNSWPHFTATYERNVFDIYQHNDTGLAARSLKNLPGGVQTNRDNIIQIELVGTADRHKAASWGKQYVENFPIDYLNGIGKWMRWVEKNHNVPRICTVPFIKYPESYGANGVRLTGSQFDAYSGWLGHQHAPENTHGDPGLINMAYLLNVDVPTKDDDMPWYKRVMRTGGGSIRVVTGEGAVAGFPNSTELKEFEAALSASGYRREKDLIFTEQDEYDRYFAHLLKG